ncbi:chromate transporter [Mesorhizobium sp. LSJC268A00]|uniref:chromate efflux transporter n=2 Tax=Mesorhizobium TaxID=68287 RepID=UPI0003CE9C0A|nr:chromate efflux transporter [Mesorhizobium sp. L2C067A000]ESX06568.1 chromate transporter [Mesorhizobium sp. LSJC268A00]ESX27707.1 chromate transporter [Mesorhizobium sp. LSJC264A00]ESZ15990.1 chromate transporter [Mesorhizobium sp. L2C085B000]ESZ41622.1 chromate transporter [Mesorhizobium sp. L2C066B000]ESZ35184.1 chromate transporter [Mesorhizobium sp. L2C067A000]
MTAGTQTMANLEQSVTTPPSLAETHDHDISFADAMRVWARVAMLSFGGPAGQIAMMHRIVVEEKRWIGETRFLHALNYCTLLPGPEAQQLAIYIGWLMHKTKGGLVAGILFVLPGAVAIMVLSWIYAIFGNVGAIQALFFGLKAAVLAIVLEAVLRIGRRALRNNVMVGLAAAAFIALFFFHAPFPLVILVAAVIGYVGGKMGWAAFQPGNGHGKLGGKQVDDVDSALGEGMPAHARPSIEWSLKIAAVFLLLWFVPVLFLLLFLGQGNVFTDIAIFFSKMAVVTFGGAYAVLAYVAQQGVEHYGWLKPGEMLDGLGMAETTPGPLIMVTQFVGFMGAFREPGVLNALVAGTLGGLLTTWVTFVPCFLWIFLGAPYIETMRSNKALSAALSTITAAVVGVILNLAVWFALHVLFRDLHEIGLLGMRLDVPVLGSLNIPSLVLTLGAMLAVFRFKVGVIPVLAACSILGVLFGVAAGSV